MEHTYSDDTYDIFTKAGQFQYNPAKTKIGVISTLPATGSETNNIFVVSRRSTNQKLGSGDMSTYPKFAIVDPCHSMSLPDNQVRNSLIDSFVHVIEQYIGHYEKNYVTDETSEEANFCYAATVALNLSLSVGVYMCLGAHNIGHELTIHYRVAHGESLALSFPGVMRFNKEKIAKKLIRMAEKNIDDKAVMTILNDIF
ncbi:alcohol dehydrogenase [Entamoeba marina]